MAPAAAGDTDLVQDRPGHHVFFFRHVEDAVAATKSVVGPVLEDGGVVVLFVDRRIRRRLRPWLRTFRGDGQGRATLRNARLALLLLRLQGLGEGKMTKFAERWLRRGRDGGSGQVAVVSQLGSTLLAQGKKDHAILFEQIWTRCYEDQPFAMICLYPLQSSGEPDEAVVGVHHDRWPGSR